MAGTDLNPETAASPRAQNSQTQGNARNFRVRRPISTREYLLLDAQGALKNQHTELIDGDIYLVSPQSSRHSWICAMIASWAHQSFPDRMIRSAMPLSGPDGNMPEPDIAVVGGPTERWIDAHPSNADLVIEVAVTSVEFDRRIKAGLYAAMGIPEYWVVLVEAGEVEVMRAPRPTAEPSTPFGHCYSETLRLDINGQIAPIFTTDQPLPVASIFPPTR